MSNDKDKDTRGVRDQAGVGPDPRQADRLVPMRTLDGFKFADGEPDIRGWELYSAKGTFVGDVDELLVDPDRGEVIMLDIDLKDAGRHTRAPIRSAWLDHDRKRVIMDSGDIDSALLEASVPGEAPARETVVERDAVRDDVVVRDDEVIVHEATSPRPVSEAELRDEIRREREVERELEERP